MNDCSLTNECFLWLWWKAPFCLIVQIERKSKKNMATAHCGVWRSLYLFKHSLAPEGYLILYLVSHFMCACVFDSFVRNTIYKHCICTWSEDLSLCCDKGIPCMPYSLEWQLCHAKNVLISIYQLLARIQSELIKQTLKCRNEPNRFTNIKRTISADQTFEQ